MAIEHVDISAGEIHEPKGINGASADQAYISDGLGSGSWQDVAVHNHYGEMEIIQNTTATAVTAATDATLYTGTDYVQLAGIFQAGTVDGVTYASDELTVPRTGVYLFNRWAIMESSVGNVNVGLKFTLNGTPGPTTIRQKISSGGDRIEASSASLISLTVGDRLGIAIACDVTANITLSDGGVSLVLVK